MVTERSRSGGADPEEPTLLPNQRPFIRGWMTETMQGGSGGHTRIYVLTGAFSQPSCTFANFTKWEIFSWGGAIFESEEQWHTCSLPCSWWCNKSVISYIIIMWHFEQPLRKKSVSDFICPVVLCFSCCLCSSGLFVFFIPGQSFLLGSEAVHVSDVNTARNKNYFIWQLRMTFGLGFSSYLQPELHRDYGWTHTHTPVHTVRTKTPKPSFCLKKSCIFWPLVRLKKQVCGVWKYLHVWFPTVCSLVCRLVLFTGGQKLISWLSLEKVCVWFSVSSGIHEGSLYSEMYTG